jgi:putative cardiolipin synthase
LAAAARAAKLFRCGMGCALGRRKPRQIHPIGIRQQDARPTRMLRVVGMIQELKRTPRSAVPAAAHATGAQIFYGALLVALLALAGCSSLPTTVTRTASEAILDTAQTRLGLAASAQLATHPGASGFSPLSQGTDALVARVALVRAAQRTLDVQYYDFHADAVGAALLNELVTAADRGVRVRLLIDDLHTKGRDEMLSAVDSHANLEVRLFNPFVHRRARWLDFLGGFSRVNRRMHNKSLTADSQVTIVGGRNIGDEYFSAPAALEFSDFDVMAIGPVVPEVSAEFDRYWNSDVVFPLASIVDAKTYAHADLPQARLTLNEQLQALRATPYATALASADLVRSLQQRNVTMYWGHATLISDQPNKVTSPPEDNSTHAMPKLAARLDQAEHELILVSPYFVPGKKGTRWLQGIAQRGVTVKVLTNSFAAIDVPGVAAAYSRYRKELVSAGVELYELKPSIAGDRKHKHTGSSKSAKSSLHAKSYMVDARTVFVGSMNLDPRSASLNTEMGLIIDSDAMCVALREELLKRLPEDAYHVQLDSSAADNGNLVWVTRDNGRDVRYTSEPDLSAWNSFTRMLQRMLPIEKQL